MHADGQRYPKDRTIDFIPDIVGSPHRLLGTPTTATGSAEQSMPPACSCSHSSSAFDAGNRDRHDDGRFAPPDRAKLGPNGSGQGELPARALNGETCGARDGGAAARSSPGGRATPVPCRFLPVTRSGSLAPATWAAAWQIACCRPAMTYAFTTAQAPERLLSKAPAQSAASHLAKPARTPQRFSR